MRMRIILIGTAAAVSAALTVLCLQAATGQPPGMADEREVRAICGTSCHVYPPPEILPRSAWPDAVARMTLFREGQPEPLAARGTGEVVLPEDMERVLAFYVRHAPVRLPAPAVWPAPAATGPQFRRRVMAPANLKGAPGISNVRFLDLDGDGVVEIVATDMR